jgi:FkbM family methyltransferase
MDTKILMMKRITINKLSFNVNENNLVFWKKVEDKKWETDTFTVFDRFLNKDTVYFDIGAWIGPTILYTAQISKYAYGFEPDPVAFDVLKANLELNLAEDWYKKVAIHNKAVSTENGFMFIGSKSGGGDSLSSVLFSDNETKWKVETIAMTDFIEKNNLKNEKLFFKMDIEGGEYFLIPVLNKTLASHNAILSLSLHPGLLFGSKAGKNSNVFSKISIWLNVISEQYKILRSLPFKYMYLQSGKRVNTFNILYYAARLRSFSILATNSSKW